MRINLADVLRKGKLIREYLDSEVSQIKDVAIDRKKGSNLGDTILHNLLTSQIRLVAYKQLVNSLSATIA